MKNISLCLIAFHSSYSHSAPALYALDRAVRQKNPLTQVDIIEELVNTPFADIVNVLTQKPYDVFAFSCYLWSGQLIRRLLPLLKKIFPRAKIVWGGPDVQGRAKELLQTNPFLDFIIEGEGENSLPRLLHVLAQAQADRDFSEVSGLAYRQRVQRAGRSCVNNEQDQLQKIQKNLPKRLLPEEIASLLPWDVFDPRHPYQKNMVYWETSRGCPFTCSFCISGREKMTYRPMQVLRQELAVLAQSPKPLTVKLLDRSFSLAKNRLLLLELFYNAPSHLRFHIEANPDYLDEDFFQALKKFPPRRLQFELGLQSFQEEVLQAVQRNMHVEKAWQNCRRLIAMGFDVHVDLLAGLPRQNFASVMKDMDKTFLLFSEHLQLGTLKVLPGSEMAKQSEKILFDTDAPYEVFATSDMSYKDLAAVRDFAKLLDRLYNSSLLRYSLFYLGSQKGISFYLNLLRQEQEGIFYKQMWQKHNLFIRVSTCLMTLYPRDGVLKEVLVWDYLCNFFPSANAPSLLQEAVQERLPLDSDLLASLEKLLQKNASSDNTNDISKNLKQKKEVFSKKSFPVFYFSQAAADFFANLPYRDAGLPVQSGLYFCLRQSGDKKGIPLLLKKQVKKN